MLALPSWQSAVVETHSVKEGCARKVHGTIVETQLNDLLVDKPVEVKARLLFGHGAGAGMRSDFMTQMAAALCSQGIEVVRFEFPYMQARRLTGKKTFPDKTDVLLQRWQALIDVYADDSMPLFIGGKSMGGRMASMWAAQNSGGQCLGVICFGYPFHPVGKPDLLRVQHLFDMPQPTLIVQGCRDKLGSRDEVAQYHLPQSVRITWVETGDHDLKPLRRSGVSHAQSIQQIAVECRNFMIKTAQVI